MDSEVLRHRVIYSGGRIHPEDVRLHCRESFYYLALEKVVYCQARRGE